MFVVTVHECTCLCKCTMFWWLGTNDRLIHSPTESEKVEARYMQQKITIKPCTHVLRSGSAWQHVGHKNFMEDTNVIYYTYVQTGRGNVKVLRGKRREVLFISGENLDWRRTGKNLCTDQFVTSTSPLASHFLFTHHISLWMVKFPTPQRS